MLRIHTVLCPIDFTDINIRELELAVDVCRSFGARMILHHNVHSSPLGASAAWLWQQEHKNRPADSDGAADMLREILAELPLDIDVEARLSNGLAAPAILHVEDQVGADLVVMATHGTSTKDHASVTEKVIEQSRCPVLVWHGADRKALHLETAEVGVEPMDVLVPTDLSPASERAVAYAFELARVLPLRIHLLHVLTPARSLWVLPGISPSMPAPAEADPFEEAHMRLELLIPEDLRARTTLHVETGEPSEQIAELAQRIGASCIVMGAHARSFLRRFFTRDTSCEMLHKTGCPVWFVPGAQAA
jgi:nucleotide-binding universal stress UspA family protein